MGAADTATPFDAPEHGARVCILALGSPHGDDAVGWLVAERLAADPQIAPWVRQLATPWDIVQHVRPADRLILIDACRGMDVPGSVTLLGEADIARLAVTRRSTHGASAPEAIALAQRLRGPLAETVVVAIEVGECGPRAGVSATAEEGVERAVAVTRRQLAEWYGRGDPK